MNGSIYIGQKALSLTEYDKSAPITGIILWADDNNYYLAGDETGTVIEQDCPYATQDIANNLLTMLQGYSYQGLEANGAKVSPIAELGDGITVDGLYTQLAYQNIRFSTGEVMDVAAPGSNETLHEYKTEGETTKQFNHQIAETRSQITKTSEEIMLSVENEINDLSASITVQLNSITSKVTGLEGDYSSLEQYVDSFTLTVSNGSTSSTIQLKAGDVLISSQNIKFSGMVTFSDLSTSGSTTINGSNITTGTISANRLDLTGEITWSDLSSNVQNDINDAYTMAEDAQSVVGGWTYGNTTYIDGAMIMTGTVMASYLLGGEVGLLDANERKVGGIDITYTSSGDGLSFWTNRGGIRIEAAGNVWLESNNGSESLGLADGYISCGGDTMPRWDDSLSLGRSSYRWSQVYAASSGIVTSDRNLKTEISYDMSKYDALFDRIRPTPYQYKNGRSRRTHTGMIAQDVENALIELGMTGTDFAGFVKDKDEKGNDVYFLRYEEFISLCIDQIQRLKSRVADLEAKV